jgi:hypothetical protein
VAGKSKAANPADLDRAVKQLVAAHGVVAAADMMQVFADRRLGRPRSDELPLTQVVIQVASVRQMAVITDAGKPSAIRWCRVRGRSVLQLHV